MDKPAKKARNCCANDCCQNGQDEQTDKGLQVNTFLSNIVSESAQVCFEFAMNVGQLKLSTTGENKEKSQDTCKLMRRVLDQLVKTKEKLDHYCSEVQEEYSSYSAKTSCSCQQRNSSNEADGNSSKSDTLHLTSEDNLSSEEPVDSCVNDSIAKKKLIAMFSDRDSDSSDESLIKKKLRKSARLSAIDNDDTDKDEKKEDIIRKKKGKMKGMDIDYDILANSMSEFKAAENAVRDKCRLFQQDEKLQSPCYVMLERIQSSVLERHKKALENSKSRMDNKEIKRLTDLSNLEGGQKRPSRSKSKDKDSIWDDFKKAAMRRKLSASAGKGRRSSDSLTEMIDSESTSDDSSTDNEIPTRVREEASTSNLVTNKELIQHGDEIWKAALLESSGSETGGQKQVVDLSSEEDEVTSTKKKKNTAILVNKMKLKNEIPNEKEIDDDEKENQDAKYNGWRKNLLLSNNPWDLHYKEIDKEKSQRKEKLENEDAEDDSECELKKRRRKKVNRRRILLSDSDGDSKNSSGSAGSAESEPDKDTDLDADNDRKHSNASSESDSSVVERIKPKRKRIRKVSDSSEDNSCQSDDDLFSSPPSGSKKGRKNIRKVMRDQSVAADTREAARTEEDRLKRIAERQKLYKDVCEPRLTETGRFVLDFDLQTKKELIVVHEKLVKHLKTHQIQGLRFIWDSCFESLQRIKESPGSGCILAHCMGLGKTLQSVTLVHTLLSHKETGMRRIMIVCPMGTILNWVNEFHKWLEDVDNYTDIEIFEMTAKFKNNRDRMHVLENWHESGGVLIISYQMFRNLAGKKLKLKYMTERIQACLLNPGPDVVVCDEGHLLKNEDTSLSKTMRGIRTLRRIILTGTPLQNNLTEYHCMVQFVKPNLLGTKTEFSNRFVNPITNGQFDDSTKYDVQLMKKRAYVLHKMLKGTVQRCGYNVLVPFLPAKHEYVIYTTLSEVQQKLYEHYLANYSRRMRVPGGSMFADFNALQRIWTHPLALQINAERDNEKNDKGTDSENSLRDFIVDGSSESENSETGNNNASDDGRKSRGPPNTDQQETPVEEQWWTQFLQPSDFENLIVSPKLMILFGILKESEEVGDKVLIFSQSLISLNVIESFLEKIDRDTRVGKESDNLLGFHTRWILNVDYFRLDGQTSAANRNTWCRIFNRPSNKRARLFLLSTKAGGLGINLTGANRVILFDTSWNPSHDVQSIFRVYRFGQRKPCYIYRLLAAGTMEVKIYNRQVTKLSLACRVVDEQQIERHYTNNDLTELYRFEPVLCGNKKSFNLPKDRVLAEILLKYNEYIDSYHTHDSLLENKVEEELNEEERKQAWLEYEEEKKEQTVKNDLIAAQMNNPSGSQPIGVRVNAQSMTQGKVFVMNQGMQRAPLPMMARGRNPTMQEIYNQHMFNKDLFNNQQDARTSLSTEYLRNLYSLMAAEQMPNSSRAFQNNVQGEGTAARSAINIDDDDDRDVIIEM